MSTLAAQPIALGTHPAVIIVDASHGFTDPNSPLGANFDAEIAVINGILDLAAGNNWPVFLSTVAYSKPTQAQVFRAKLPALNILEAGSDNVALDARLQIPDGSHIITKHHASCFHNTELHALLQAHGVDSLVCAGFTTSGCVRATAVDGLQYDYRTFIIEDAVGDRDETAHAANLRDFKLKYGEVISFAVLKNMVGA